MCHSCFLLVAVAMVASACSGGTPAGPTVMPTQALPPAGATSRPGVWDSRDELALWVNNGLSAGPASIVGDGDAAIIRIDVGGANIRLQGPAFDPPVTDLRSIRVRYRWLDGTNGDYGLHGHYLSLDWLLQVPVPDPHTGPPSLFIVVANRTGDWVEQDALANFVFTPPYSARSALLTICGTCGERGSLEIDWIALIRQ